MIKFINSLKIVKQVKIHWLKFKIGIKLEIYILLRGRMIKLNNFGKMLLQQYLKQLDLCKII